MILVVAATHSDACRHMAGEPRRSWRFVSDSEALRGWDIHTTEIRRVPGWQAHRDATAIALAAAHFTNKKRPYG